MENKALQNVCDQIYLAAMNHGYAVPSRLQAWSADVWSSKHKVTRWDILRTERRTDASNHWRENGTKEISICMVSARCSIICTIPIG